MQLKPHTLYKWDRVYGEPYAKILETCYSMI